MKPLILILLASTYAAAQTPTIADIARQERARRGQNTSTKVYTIKSAEPVVAAEPDKTAPAPGTAPATTTPEAAAGEAPKLDPVQQWLADTEKLRVQIRELVDQEATTQLDINSITNRIYAPVTSVSERDRAQVELQAAQARLVTVRDNLAKRRAELQTRELEGPPKKQ